MKSKTESNSSSFIAKKSLGQHFLNSDAVPNWLCDAADLVPGDVVLEIGPGTGVLTRELLKRSVHVVAVETDKRSLELLQKDFASYIKTKQLQLVAADVRNGLPDHPLLSPGNFKVVANIPYYLSGFLFRTLLETHQQPHTAVLLVQKEVAERVARDQKSSLLSLSVKLFGTPTYIRTVSRGHFNPPPKVASAILAITNIGHRHIPPSEVAAFFSFLHLGFAHKRKQLVGNLSSTYERAHITAALQEIGLDEHIRGEDIPLTTWIELYWSLGPQP